MSQKEKVILAYSGGLDTSIVIEKDIFEEISLKKCVSGRNIG